MKQISLTQGKFALVDDEDYECLNRWKWYAIRHSNTFYARRALRVTERLDEKQSSSVEMPQFLIGKKEWHVIDHINGNGLDNRRENLRHVTIRQNSQNRHVIESSKYPGVRWRSRYKKWEARTLSGNKSIFLGHFENEIDAYSAYCEKVMQITGERVLYKEAAE